MEGRRGGREKEGKGEGCVMAFEGHGRPWCILPSSIVMFYFRLPIRSAIIVN